LFRLFAGVVNTGGNLPPLSTLPLEGLIQVANFKFGADVVDTGGKFATVSLIRMVNLHL
jgi:hypothetical protein